MVQTPNTSDTSSDETSDNFRSPVYNPETGKYQVYHDMSGQEEIGVTVVSAVSDIADIPSEELRLNNVVDPEALDSIFSKKANGAPRIGGNVDFVLAGYRVTVHGDGRIEIASENGRSKKRKKAVK